MYTTAEMMDCPVDSKMYRPSRIHDLELAIMRCDFQVSEEACKMGIAEARYIKYRTSTNARLFYEAKERYEDTLRVYKKVCVAYHRYLDA